MPDHKCERRKIMGKRRHLYIPGYENKAETNGTANSRPKETRSTPRATNPRIEIRDEEQPTYVQTYENTRIERPETAEDTRHDTYENERQYHSRTDEELKLQRLVRKLRNITESDNDTCGLIGVFGTGADELVKDALRHVRNIVIFNKIPITLDTDVYAAMGASVLEKHQKYDNRSYDSRAILRELEQVVRREVDTEYMSGLAMMQRINRNMERDEHLKQAIIMMKNCFYTGYTKFIFIIDYGTNPMDTKFLEMLKKINGGNIIIIVQSLIGLNFQRASIGHTDGSMFMRYFSSDNVFCKDYVEEDEYEP